MKINLCALTEHLHGEAVYWRNAGLFEEVRFDQPNGIITLIPEKGPRLVIVAFEGPDE